MGNAENTEMTHEWGYHNKMAGMTASICKTCGLFRVRRSVPAFGPDLVSILKPDPEYFYVMPSLPIQFVTEPLPSCSEVKMREALR